MWRLYAEYGRDNASMAVLETVGYPVLLRSTRGYRVPTSFGRSCVSGNRVLQQRISPDSEPRRLAFHVVVDFDDPVVVRRVADQF